MTCPSATLAACARLRRQLHRAAHVARALALVALLAGCEGGSEQSGSAFVFLSIDGFSLTGTAIVSSIPSSTSQGTTTIACVTLRNNLKNPTITGPSALDNVIIQSYTVTLTRLSGAGPNGPFTFGTAVLVPAGTAAANTNVLSGNTATFAVIVVPAGAKGGAGTVATAEVRFSGHDGRGNSINEEGAVTILFQAGAEPTVSCGTAAPPPTNGNGANGRRRAEPDRAERRRRGSGRQATSGRGRPPRRSRRRRRR